MLSWYVSMMTFFFFQFFAVVHVCWLVRERESKRESEKSTPVGMVIPQSILLYVALRIRGMHAHMANMIFKPTGPGPEQQTQPCGTQPS